MASPKPFIARLGELPYWQAYLSGSFILLVSFWAWWVLVFTAPAHVFWRMLENSLSTGSVVVESRQITGRGSIKQLIHMDTAQAGQAHSLTTLTQGTTSVQTEVIGTRTTDYTRYTRITSDKKIDFSKLRNIWAKSEDTQQSNTQASGHQLFAQAVLGVGLPLGSVPVPIGDLTPVQRENLMRYIRNQNVYQPSWQTVKKERKNGRLYYTYPVKIQTILYVSLMKRFANYQGLSELDAVDPNTYQSAAPLELKLTVDAYTHQLVAVDFGTQDYTQRYVSYDLPLHARVPTQFITSTELQERLSKLEAQ